MTRTMSSHKRLACAAEPQRVVKAPAVFQAASDQTSALERDREALGGARSGQDGSVIEVGLVVGFKADEMRIERYRMLAQARLAVEAVRFG